MEIINSHLNRLDAPRPGYAKVIREDQAGDQGTFSFLPGIRATIGE
jgi:hypothetical protein